MAEMRIQNLVLGMVATNCYFLLNADTKEMILVDPADEAEAIEEKVNAMGGRPVAVLLTHGHFDHILGLDTLLKLWQVPVYVEEEDQEILMDTQLNQSAIYTAGYTFSGARSVRDGEVLSLAGYDFQVFHTPGHTRGGCCYYVASEHVLFSGDTLFQNSVGRTDFVNSSTSDLIRSIREKLLPLPDDTVVYPGHMGETTIGHERKYNPFL